MSESENDKSTTKSFGEVLLREGAIINPNVSAKSVERAMTDGNLSWTLVENQRKHVVIERLGAITGFDETQCDRLFDKLDGMIPTDSETEQAKAIAAVKNVFYKSWLMKCMHRVSKCNIAHEL